MIKETEPIRERFNKPYHFLRNIGEDPLQCLTEIFINFHLDDFREDLNLWQEIALSNDQSAYDDGCAREDLIDFLKWLHRLIEAFHIINEKRNNRKKKKLPNKPSKKTREQLLGLDIPVLLTPEEKAKPLSVLKQFCKTFDKAYTQIELLDLLDAVFTYEGDKKIYKGNTVLFYQHVSYLIKLAHKMRK